MLSAGTARCGPAPQLLACRSCPALLYPNLPIAGGGTVPFIGDYIALAPGVPLVRNPPGGTLPAWRFANQSQDPVKFLAFFTSTQDVGFPLNAGNVPDINGNWTQFAAGFSSCINPKTRDSNIYFSANQSRYPGQPERPVQDTGGARWQYAAVQRHR